MERAEIITSSPWGNRTNDAVIPEIFSISSAAVAARIRDILLFSAAMAISFRYSLADLITWYLAMVSWKSFCSSFLTSMVSAPSRCRKAAASKVRSPVRMLKLLVSRKMPAISDFASMGSTSALSTAYCSSSVTSSAVEDAYGSWKFTTTGLI